MTQSAYLTARLVHKGRLTASIVSGGKERGRGKMKQWSRRYNFGTVTEKEYLLFKRCWLGIIELESTILTEHWLMLTPSSTSFPLYSFSKSLN